MRSTAASGISIRTLAAAGVCAALLAGMSVALDGAIASTGPQAVAAKKKCKQKPRSAQAAKKKCKKRAGSNPVADAIAFLGGKRLSRVIYNQTSGTSSTEAFDFCRNGTLRFRGDYNGYSGSWADVGGGTWQVVSAVAGSAQVAIAIQSWSSTYFDGSPGPDAPPGSGTVGMQLTGPNTVNAAGVEYSVSAGPC